VILEIASRLAEKRSRLDDWWQSRIRDVPEPLTVSMDIRHSGPKIAPVDINCFPAGFSLLCKEDFEMGARAFRETLSRRVPGAKSLALIPEFHTVNVGYIENVAALRRMLIEAGYAVTIVSLHPEQTVDRVPVDLPDGSQIILEKGRVEGGRLVSASGTPDAVVLNHDLMGGPPPELMEISQPILPRTGLGWHQRSKFKSFEIYNTVAREFASVLDLDPFAFTVETRIVTNVDFLSGRGLDEVAREVDRLAGDLAKTYAARETGYPPYVVVKSDAGTYGMSVMEAESGEELLRLNRKQRNAMHVTKGRSTVSSVILQEGIPTADRLNEFVIEPVLYRIGHKSIGAFFRSHGTKSERQNLNARGAQFQKICLEPLTSGEVVAATPILTPESLAVLDWIGNLATLTVGLEEQELGR